MRGRLDIDADLRVSCGSGRIRVRGSGSRLRGELDRLRTGLDLHGFGPGRGWRRITLHRLDDALRSGDLTLAIACRGSVLAEIGTGRRAGWLSRMVGFAPARIRPLGVLRAMVSRRRTHDGRICTDRDETHGR